MNFKIELFKRTKDNKKGKLFSTILYQTKEERDNAKNAISNISPGFRLVPCDSEICPEGQKVYAGSGYMAIAK